jgi:hypothetical protein
MAESSPQGRVYGVLVWATLFSQSLTLLALFRLKYADNLLRSAAGFGYLRFGLHHLVAALYAFDFFDIIFQKQHHGIYCLAFRAAGPGNKTFLFTCCHIAPHQVTTAILSAKPWFVGVIRVN